MGAGSALLVELQFVHNAYRLTEWIFKCPAAWLKSLSLKDLGEAQHSHWNYEVISYYPSLINPAVSQALIASMLSYLSLETSSQPGKEEGNLWLFTSVVRSFCNFIFRCCMLEAGLGGDDEQHLRSMAFLLTHHWDKALGSKDFSKTQQYFIAVLTALYKWN